MFSTNKIACNEGDFKILKGMAGKIKVLLHGETWSVVTNRLLMVVKPEAKGSLGFTYVKTLITYITVKM